MNNNLFYGLLLLFFNYGCTNVHSQETASISNSQDSVYISRPTYFSDDFVREDALYTSIIRVIKQKNNDYALSVEMILKKDAYFVSPNTKRDFLGKFTIVLTEPDKLQLSEEIVETPISEEEINKHEGLVNFVRKNINYKKTIIIKSNENFEASGYIQFTIEPRCTLEKIPFVLSFVNGKLSVKVDGC